MRYASILLTVAYVALSVRPVYADQDKQQFYAFLEKNFSNLTPTAFLPNKGFVLLALGGDMQKWYQECLSNPGENPYRLVVHYLGQIGSTLNTEKLQSTLTKTQAFAEKNPKFFWAQYVYTVNLLKLEDKERFIKQIQKMMRMEPEDAYGYLILAQFGLVMEDIQYVDNLFKKATKNHPNVAILFHEYGSFLENYVKDSDRAALQYLKAIKINGYKNSYLDLAALYVAQNRYEEAVEVYDAALSQYPSDVHFLRSKGIMLVLLNRIAEGLPLIEEAVKIDPKDGKTYWFLGMAHKANKDKGKACAAFKKAVELGYEDAKQNLSEYCE